MRSQPGYMQTGNEPDYRYVPPKKEKKYPTLTNVDTWFYDISPKVPGNVKYAIAMEIVDIKILETIDEDIKNTELQHNIEQTRKLKRKNEQRWYKKHRKEKIKKVIEFHQKNKDEYNQYKREWSRKKYHEDIELSRLKNREKMRKWRNKKKEENGNNNT